jgi:CBS domain-containing protein
MAKLTLEDLLRTKESGEIWSISPKATVFDALKMMADKQIGALVVLDGEHLAGIFSERDYARKIILKGKCSLDTPVDEIMTSKVITVTSDDSIEEGMQLMTNHHIRHLPVVKGEQLLGVVSIGDIVKAIITDKEQLIDHLESYIGKSVAKI